MSVRIGISGWRYKGWRGSFYPKELPQRSELSYAAQRLATIELNGSFYSLQKPASYRRWYDETPADFVFAVKASRFITHVKRLKDIDVPFANFLASGPLALDEKLGPLLWQFPPNFRWHEERFEAFLQALPKTTKQAAKLARKHDARVSEPWLSVPHERPMRHAVEPRHPSFADPALIAQLRRHGVAMVVADSAGHYPVIEDVTADFVYVRLHGDEELYRSGYNEQALQRWADRIRRWQGGEEPEDAQRYGDEPPERIDRDVYVYFDNDAKVRAPVDAQRLAEILRE